MHVAEHTATLQPVPYAGGPVPPPWLNKPCPGSTCPAAVNVRQQTLDAASRNIQTLKREIERTKQTDAGRLRAEYQRLVQVGGRLV